MTALLQNKLLTFLLAVALVFGIAAEGMSLFTNYYVAQKTIADSESAKATADYADKLKAAEADLAKQNALVQQQAAANAEALKRAEADKMQAEALVTQQNALIQQQAAANAEVLKKAEADKAQAEAQLAAQKTAMNKIFLDALSNTTKTNKSGADSYEDIARKASKQFGWGQ